MGTSKPVADPVAVVRAAAEVKAVRRRRERPRIPVVPIAVVAVAAALVFWIIQAVIKNLW
jgi:hypothetical protein